MASDQWNAAGYERNARFVSDLGMPVVELLAPKEHERILDLGCGDGALTAKLPGRVVGIDSSESMVQSAVARGVEAQVADMHAFALGQRFDAVFTNAVLHWTRDIDRVLTCVAGHLEPGGRFVGEFGGFGNVAAITTAILAALEIEHCRDAGFRWYFPTPAEFSARLEVAGFVVERVELIPRPTPLPTGMHGWLETFGKPYCQHLDAEATRRVVDRAVALLANTLRDGSGGWTADYVRLRFAARISSEVSEKSIT
jgi:trans-aconitate methyltransferase